MWQFLKNMENRRRIYLDHAATTRVREEVLEAMMPYFLECYGNAESGHGMGTESRRAVNRARRGLAGTLGAKPEEIFFTSGGSEADNWAIRGVAEAYKKKGRHIVTTRMEHMAVLNSCAYLERQGCEVSYIGITEDGFVKLEELERAIRPDTVLVSIMYANNETGVIQPIREIAEMVHRHGVVFHTDGVQAYGQIPVSVEDGFDLLSASGHKFNGPKGTGFLYCRESVQLENLIFGGKQECGRRAGTENVHGIAGLAKAAELAQQEMEDRIRKETELRDWMMRELTERFSNVRCNGDRVKRLPGNINVSFCGREAEELLIRLDGRGICASGGSACATGEGKPSHVLQAMGLSETEMRGAVRMTLGYENTREEIEYVMEQFAEILNP